MLNKNEIHSLSLILNDSFNKNLRDDIARKKINAILHNKSINTVIQELYNYINDKKKLGKQKNIVTLIVIMSLLCRNCNCLENIKTALLKYNLTGCLYGGLYMLLSGNSKIISLKIKLNDYLFNNKYDYINRFSEFCYWEYILVFDSVKILYLLDEKKFEELSLKDKSHLILLNMVTYHLNIKPSDNLITKLLQSTNELYQNIGLFFITEKITSDVNDIVQINRCKKNGFSTSKNIKTVQKSLETEINKFCKFIKLCNKKTQASLIFNYILVHQNQYPNTFAYMLISSALQEEFINQISNSGKIKVIKDVHCVIDLITRTPALNEENKRISKAKLYMAITDLFISFLEERKIYTWEEQDKIFMKDICEKLPPRCIRKLHSYLTNKEKYLMCKKIDKLIRFKIYLQDKRMYDIISGILNIIEITNSHKNSAID